MQPFLSGLIKWQQLCVFWQPRSFSPPLVPGVWHQATLESCADNHPFCTPPRLWSYLPTLLGSRVVSDVFFICAMLLVVLVW